MDGGVSREKARCVGFMLYAALVTLGSDLPAQTPPALRTGEQDHREMMAQRIHSSLS